MDVEGSIALGIFLGFCLMEITFSTFFRQKEAQPYDGIVDTITLLLPALITRPLIFFSAFAGMGYFLPETKGSLSTLSIPLGLLLLVFADDLVQYWQHRLIHTVPWLYNLHRVHHQAGYMSVRMSARSGFFHLLLMPNYWLGATLVYMGLGWAYVIYVLTKGFLGLSAHSNLRWDIPLYNIQWLSPVMWVVERIIVTPAFHAAHHGRHQEDGITNYKGNYGALLSVWDLIFGTAKITRKAPDEFGIENLAPMSIPAQIFWPLIWAPVPAENKPVRRVKLLPSGKTNKKMNYQ